MKNSNSVWNIITSYKINSIFTKFFLLIFITVVIPLIGIGVAVYLYIDSNNDKEIKYAYEQSLLKISDTVDMIYDDIEKLSIRLSTDREIIALLSNSNDNYSYESKILIQSILNKINLPTSQYIDTIVLYSRVNDAILSSPGYYTNISDFGDIGWYDTYLKLTPQKENITEHRIATVKSIASTTKQNYITSIRNVPINSPQNYGAVVINIDLKRFKRFTSGEDTTSNEDVYILGKEKSVIYNKNDKYIGNAMSDVKPLKGITLGENLSEFLTIDGSRKLVVQYVSKITGYTYVSLVSIDNELKAASLRNILFMFILAGILFSGFIAIVVALNLYKPFGDIISFINNTNHGEESIMISKKTKFNDLKYIFSIISSFNIKKADMEMDLSNSLAKLKKSQTIALQAQINPHFLYNTLNAIKWMTMEYTHGENEASRAITTLAQLLRLSLETKENMIHIQSEVEHAKKYISIEMLRFEEMFEVIWDIQDEVMDFMIVKITFQPIIENAIYHGIKQILDKGIIIIRGEVTENLVIIEIEDNGIGLEANEIERINNELEQEHIKEDNSIGLKNVNQRIKLIFGEDYGVKLYSANSRGTIVKIVIPKVK